MDHEPQLFVRQQLSLMYTLQAGRSEHNLAATFTRHGCGPIEICRSF
jgi:hypothetical protein